MNARCCMLKASLLKIACLGQLADASPAHEIADTHPVCGLIDGDKAVAVYPLKQAAIPLGDMHDALEFVVPHYLERVQHPESCPHVRNFFDCGSIGIVVRS